MTLLERFKRHVMWLDDSDDACWIWVGACENSGRGKLKVNGKHVAAHRIAWEYLNGRSLEKGMRLRQECSHPQCVRHWRVERPWKKLTDAEVYQITRSSMPSHSLAVQYGVSDCYVRRIKCGAERSGVTEQPMLANGRACA